MHNTRHLIKVEELYSESNVRLFVQMFHRQKY